MRYSNSSVVEVEVGVAEEVFKDMPVAGVVGKVVVVFWSNLSDFFKIPPGTSWEIMVLDMISDIHVRNIPPSNVVISFLSLNEFIVLCDDMDSCRVWSD